MTDLKKQRECERERENIQKGVSEERLKRGRERQREEERKRENIKKRKRVTIKRREGGLPIA